MFLVDFHLLDGRDHVVQSEVGGFFGSLSSFVDRYLNTPLVHPADGIVDLVDSDSSTIKSLANKFVSLNPNNQELQAKDMYYWTAWWVEYESDWSTQWETSIETINGKDGVCINYAAVLASLYEVANLDAKVMWGAHKGFANILPEDMHGTVLLYFPEIASNYYSEDGWLFLDPTWCRSQDWRFGEWYHDYEYRDIADVE